MANIKYATDILLQCTKALKKFKNQAESISKNRDVIDWQRVNIDSFGSIIEDLGLPKDLRQARDTYPDIAQQVLEAINHLNNSIANLESDIKLGPLPASEAVPLAERLKTEVADLIPSMNKLQLCKTKLESSSITLRKNLCLKTLLPLARASAEGKKKSIFETGYSIYLIATLEKGVDYEKNINMYTYFESANRLQTKLSELNTEGISIIGTSLINQQVRLCHDGLQEVKDFVLFIENYLKKDLNHINVFHAELTKVTQRPLTDILFSIPNQTLKVSACIREFIHKKFLMEELERAAQLILMVEQFHKILNNHFIDYLAEQNRVANSLLNPATLAKARGSSYFSGLRGLWRMIRILLGSFNQQAAISEEILQEKLQDLLTNSTNFFRHDKKDHEHITEFIESYFSQYSKPFPHDELVNTAKKCLITYGTILEKVMCRYKIDKGDTTSYSLGGLSGKIEIRTTNLRKYREKLTSSESS